MPLQIGSLTVDCKDPRKVADFWIAALGGEESYEDEAEGAVGVDFEMDSGTLSVMFYRVDDEKKGKNKLHFDLAADDQDAEVQRLLKLGARKIDIGQRDVSWVVMADVEGNEFCVLSSDEDE